MSNVKSMTSYAKSERKSDTLNLSVEIRSVNHRFLDINFKIPQSYWGLENKFRKLIACFVTRGHLDVVIQREDVGINTEPLLSINKGLLESYLAVYEEATQNYLGSSINTDVFFDLLNKKDVIISKNNELLEKEEEETLSLLKEVLLKLNDMKEKEGEALKIDLENRFKVLNKIKDEISILENHKKENRTYFNNLKDKIEKVTKDYNIAINEDRIVTEVALIVDRLDITEELVRLNSHFEQAKNIFQEFPLGRKLEFLLQEISREFNTIASKINDAKIQALVVEAKGELEKIREQIQNIE